MKEMKILLATLLIIISTSFIGCIEQQSNDDGTITEFQLDLIALIDSDFEGFDPLGNEYFNSTYTMENLTGNDITWTIKEGYFATYACNTSRVSESILRFNSMEKANQNINLSKPFFLLNNVTEQSMESIGNKSFLLKGSMIIKDNMTDFYYLCFTFYDIYVTLQCFGSEYDEVLSYAQIIESRIKSAIE